MSKHTALDYARARQGRQPMSLPTILGAVILLAYVIDFAVLAGLGSDAKNDLYMSVQLGFIALVPVLAAILVLVELRSKRVARGRWPAVRIVLMTVVIMVVWAVNVQVYLAVRDDIDVARQRFQERLASQPVELGQ